MLNFIMDMLIWHCSEDALSLKIISQIHRQQQAQQRKRLMRKSYHI